MKEIRLEDVFEFVRNGKSIKQEDGKGGYPITRIETIWNETIDIQRFGYADINEDKLIVHEKYFLQKGDILMSHINSPKHLGKSAMYEGRPDKLIHGMNLLCMRADQNVSYPKYLKYYFNSKFFKNQIPKIANQSVNQASFSAGNLKKLKIPLPPLNQQKKIAAILDAADAYKQKTKALIKKYDELTQSLFIEMFGDPVTNPKGWEVVPFSDVAINKNSLRVPIKQADRDNMKGSYPYYGATGIVDFINDFKFDGEFLLVAEDGKNLVNRKKPIAWIVNGQFWVNNHSHVLGYKGVANLTYLSFQLNGTDISHYVTGIDQFKMNKSNLNRIPVPIPHLRLQNQFAERVKAIEAQKEQAQASLAQAEDLFNSLLQKAFKGELAA